MDSTSPPPTIIATILNIYGRSREHFGRSAFYTTLLEMPRISSTLYNTHTPVLIMGDFNYSYEKHRQEDGTLTSAPAVQVSLLDTLLYVNCFQDQKQITSKSKEPSSILDFIFCSSADYILLVEW
ncbi:hypothetical protein PS15m_009072 [Mucor circinelloides]